MDIYSQLLTRQRYEEVIRDFRRKAFQQPSRLLSSPVVREVNLQWLLYESETAIRELVRGIQQKSYLPLPASTNRIKFDKWRDISSLSWPDRLVETVLSRAIVSRLDSLLSDRVHSFRKGYGNFQAVRACAKFVGNAERNDKPIFIARRDIQSYGDSIHRPTLFQQLRDALGSQDEYVFTLLEAFLSCAKRPELPDDIGIPTGISLTPLCENLYLNDLDHDLKRLHNLFYLRFGDDMIFASPLPEQVATALNILHEHISPLGLKTRADKELNVVFRSEHEGFTAASEVEYLGLAVLSNGSVFLSKAKKRAFQAELRRLCRQSFHTLRRLKYRKEDCVAPLVDTIRTCFTEELRHPYFSLLLKTVDDTNELKKLDTWIARLPLSQVYGSTHDRVFRHCSRKKLRELGLPSIQSLRVDLLRSSNGKRVTS